MQESLGNNNKKLIIAIGNVIKKHRLLTGKSIYAISAECGVPKSTWQDVETCGGSCVSLPTLWKISEGLEIPIENLLAEVRQELGEDFTLIE